MSGKYGLSPMAEALMMARTENMDEPYSPSFVPLTLESKISSLEITIAYIDEWIAYANGPLASERTVHAAELIKLKAQSVK